MKKLWFVVLLVAVMLAACSAGPTPQQLDETGDEGEGIAIKPTQVAGEVKVPVMDATQSAATSILTVASFAPTHQVGRLWVINAGHLQLNIISNRDVPPGKMYFHTTEDTIFEAAGIWVQDNSILGDSADRYRYGYIFKQNLPSDVDSFWMNDTTIQWTPWGPFSALTTETYHGFKKENETQVVFTVVETPIHHPGTATGGNPRWDWMFNVYPAWVGPWYASMEVETNCLGLNHNFSWKNELWLNGQFGDEVFPNQATNTAAELHWRLFDEGGTLAEGKLSGPDCSEKPKS